VQKQSVANVVQRFRIITIRERRRLRVHEARMHALATAVGDFVKELTDAARGIGGTQQEKFCFILETAIGALAIV
jgi:predicted proteasome-type protease